MKLLSNEIRRGFNLRRAPEAVKKKTGPKSEKMVTYFVYFK
jgi:hypothetical protein